MERTININDTYVITSRGLSVTINAAKLSDEILSKVFDYGITQVISDAASGAKMAALSEKFGDKADAKDTEQNKWIASDAGKAKAAEHAQSLMQGKVDALLAGDWTTRGTGYGMEGVAVMRLVAALLEPKSAEAKAWAKLSWTEKMAKAMDNAKAHPDYFTESRIADMVATIEAERKAKRERDAQAERERAALAGKVKIKL